MLQLLLQQSTFVRLCDILFFLQNGLKKGDSMTLPKKYGRWGGLLSLKKSAIGPHAKDLYWALKDGIMARLSTAESETVMDHCPGLVEQGIPLFSPIMKLEIIYASLRVLTL